MVKHVFFNTHHDLDERARERVGLLKDLKLKNEKLRPLESLVSLRICTNSRRLTKEG